MSVLLELAVRFFLCGLFAIGGGLATLPFLYDIAQETGWYTAQDVSNMIAISESTPGPMGVNMATYVGYHVEGLAGAIVTPLALVLPSVIVIVAVSRILDQFKTSRPVQHALYGLRAASAALIAAAGLGVAKIAFLHTDLLAQAGSALGENLPALFNWKSICLAVVVYLGIVKWNFHPILYIVFSATVGILFQFQ